MGVDPVSAPMDVDPRFEQQLRFAPLGPAGQQRLAAASVLVVGVGALGCATALSLHRAGVGRLVLVDRDLVDVRNLPRQVLFDEADARAGRAKVEAAADALARGGGPTQVETHAVHADGRNLPRLVEGCDLVCDGTDNLSTRYVLNDVCVRGDTPWIYAGVVGASGLTLAVRPGHGPCLRCVFPVPPPVGSLDTCVSAGVIQPAVAAVAGLQAAQALRLIGADPDAARPEHGALVELDLWTPDVRRVQVERDPGCPCCVQRDFAFLDADAAEESVRLCGRNAVQVTLGSGGSEPSTLVQHLERSGAERVVRAGHLVRFEVEGLRLTVFPDRRTLVEGSDDTELARAVVDRWLGA